MRKGKTFQYAIFGLALLAGGFLSALIVDRGFSATAYYQRASAYLGTSDYFNGEKNSQKNDKDSQSKEKNSQNKNNQNENINLVWQKKLKEITKPWGSVVGLTMFRGSPTRTFYGIGPLPTEPNVLWRFPASNEKPLCSFSEAEGVTKQWCGTGWTGQPVVWERPDGITEIIFGAYDGAVHFLNAKTGFETRPKFQTGDLIKGSVTLDPDGYPLLYFGSRDNKLRILALDRDVPTELWSLDADAVVGKWNNDWDGNPVVVNDYLFEGGENSWFFTVKINRSYKTDEISGARKVAIDPKIVFQMPGWNDELLANIGDSMVSIESSVTFFDNRVYFANSGGRIVGLDITNIGQGIAPIVFDYWVGDDTDATIVADEDGMLYVAVELERMNARSAELGQFIKLDPSKQKIDQNTGAIIGNPYVWGVAVPKDHMDKGGIWATPALFGNYLYVATHTGNLLTIDRATGSVTNKDFIGEHAWSSPVVIDGKLLVSTCTPGGFRQYDLSNPALPKLTNVMLHKTGACIESTPAVWKGQIFVGTRDGYFYSFGDK